MPAARLILPALLLLPACVDGPPDPCDADPYACENTDDGWSREPRCELEGELEVVLGHGETRFEVLPEGALPTIVDGAQGGKHVYLSLRVENPALDRYDTLLVDYKLTYRLQDGACAGGVIDTGGDECDLPMGHRTLVLGKSHPLRVVDAAVEEFGLLVFIEAAPEGVWDLTLTVEDPCGRSGTVKRQVIHGE